MNLDLVVLAFHLLSWTNPAFNADTAGCGPGLLPEHLASMEVLIDRIHQPPETLRISVVGREGLRDSAYVDDGGGLHTTVWVRAVDLDGNPSCEWSNPKTLNGSVSVPEQIAVRVEYFDLQGRRLDRIPTVRGEYFRRTTMLDGSVVKRRVVVR